MSYREVSGFIMIIWGKVSVNQMIVDIGLKGHISNIRIGRIGKVRSMEIGYPV